MGIAIGGGSLSVAALVVSLVQWSLRRNVAHEDAAKEKLERRLTHVEQKMETRIETVEKSFGELRTQFIELRGETRNLLTLVSELRGLIHEMRTAMDTARDKQANFYREELAKVEQLLRQDMTRAVQPSFALGSRVDALEAAVAALKPKKR